MRQNWAEIFPWRALVRASLWANEPINEFDRWSGAWPFETQVPPCRHKGATHAKRSKYEPICRSVVSKLFASLFLSAVNGSSTQSVNVNTIEAKGNFRK